MKVGIFGSNGYIGSFLMDQFRKKGYTVFGLDYRNRLLDIQQLQTMNVVIFLGGISKRSMCDIVSENQLREANIEAVCEIAKAMRNTQLLIYFSSAGIYESFGSIPGKEDNVIDDKKLDWYSYSVLQRENALSAIQTCKIVGLRTGMTVGISNRQRFDLGFQKMFMDAIKNKRIIVDNDSLYRPILGFYDLFNAIETLIMNKDSFQNEIYNLSSFNILLYDLAKFLGNKLGAEVLLDENGTKKSNIGFSMNTDKFTNQFKFKWKETKETLFDELFKNIHIFQNHNNSCKVCRSKQLINILSLGNHYLVNNLLSHPDESSESFPLDLYRCEACSHTQLGYNISPDKMFKYYTYVSGVSKTSLDHFKTLYNYLSGKFDSAGTILEIASNDGCQLDFFKSNGWATYGVDPAENICELAKKKGHTILCDYWGKPDLKMELPATFNIIIAQNVLAHVPNPDTFINNCVQYMNDASILYIQTSQSEMFKRNEFDTIYHEHMSFFTLSSFKHLFENNNLVIVDFIKYPIHGTSYGLLLKKKTKYLKDHSDSFLKSYIEEQNAGLFTTSFYYSYRMNVTQFKVNFANIVESLANTHKIVAYGAAAKGITLINYLDIKCIHYIVDDCDLKIGKYTPGSKIPVVDFSTLASEKDTICVLILPWNIKDELIRKIMSVRMKSNTKILVPFPKIEVY